MSKEYNHKTKRWEEPKEKTGSLKKPVTCRGGKPHDFILLIPSYYKRIRPIKPEDTNMFYLLQEREYAFRKGQEEAHERIGIRYSGYFGRMSYFYKCSVCGKEKTEYKKINSLLESDKTNK